MGVPDLKNRIQAAVMLVDHLLKAHGDVLVDLNFALANELRKWVADAQTSVPTSRATTVKRCGRLRREPDGSWWWGPYFLGWDDDPEASLELGSQIGVVTITLGEELDAAATRLREAGDEAGSRALRAMVRRYNRWQSSGVW